VEQIEKSGKKPLLAVIAGHTTPLNDYLSSAVSDAASTTDIAYVLQKAGVKIIEDIDTIGSAVEQAVTQSRTK
jgi:succinyl-CoA synthetase alpha subunit